MTYWQELLLIVGMMLVTFGVRYPVLALAGRFAMPVALVRALRFVPVAVLSAIAVPMMLQPDGHLLLSLSNAHLVAGVAAIVVAAVSRRLLVTILIGMTIFVILRLL